jgi:hypothetical protein
MLPTISELSTSELTNYTVSTLNRMNSIEFSNKLKFIEFQLCHNSINMEERDILKNRISKKFEKNLKRINSIILHQTKSL